MTTEDSKKTIKRLRAQLRTRDRKIVALEKEVADWVSIYRRIRSGRFVYP